MKATIYWKSSWIDALVTGHQHREIATKLNGIPVKPGFRGAFVGEITLEIEPMAKGYHVIGSDALFILLETNNQMQKFYL